MMVPLIEPEESLRRQVVAMLAEELGGSMEDAERMLKSLIDAEIYAIYRRREKDAFFSIRKELEKRRTLLHIDG